MAQIVGLVSLGHGLRALRCLAAGPGQHGDLRIL